jgi:hypothetical protein
MQKDDGKEAVSNQQCKAAKSVRSVIWKARGESPRDNLQQLINVLAAHAEHLLHLGYIDGSCPQLPEFS